MNSEHTIQLSGPFDLIDSRGRTWQARGIRIFDEGYGIIDVYVELDAPMEDVPLHEDPLVINQIVWRLRALGYAGPDFGPGHPGLQEDNMIVLEAPEEFAHFAADHGWRNLAMEYGDTVGEELPPDVAAQTIYAALMYRLTKK
jgi:hypothetical protein